MKKAEYIEKYGEEAWERKRARDKAYYQANKERYIERAAKWVKENPDKRKVIRKKWDANNPDKVAGKLKRYRSRKREELKISERKYRKTKFGKAIAYASNYSIFDKSRGFDITNNIDASWIVDNIFSGQKCVYCGDQDWAHLGCDRIDNNKPHTPDNIVCSCGLCNIERNDRYTVEEFKEYRKLHPRECDIPKAPAIQLSETGALKKRAVLNG